MMRKQVTLGFILTQIFALSSCNENTVEPAVEPQFEDINWSLIEYTSSEGTQAMLIDDTAYQFRAVSDTGKLKALADCNAGTGGYQLNDGSVVLDFGLFEEAVCEGQSEQSWILQHSAIEDMLFSHQNSQKMYAFDDDSLVISLADGRYMVFNQVNQFSRP